MKVTILGCGASGGVPLSSGVWGACDPLNPKNKRRRVSLAIETSTTTLIIDTSPDFREQVLEAQIKWIDGVLYTHAHADHIHGIDDLRSFAFRQEKPINIYVDSVTLKEIGERFSYVLPKEKKQNSIYDPIVVPHIISGPFQIGDIHIIPFEQDHGYSTSLGFRFGQVAYSTDVVNLSEQAFSILEGIDYWIVDCLSYDPRPTHSHLEKTLSWIQRINPKKAYLTHMSALLDYDDLLSKLPTNTVPAYDMLEILIC